MSRQSSSIEKGQVVAVIPARYGSTRFPGKPLALLRGLPLIAHVVRAAKGARRVGEVLVATDDERIARAAREAGASVQLTRGDHATGSDRIGEVVQEREEELVLNVQGDEPLVRPSAIDRLVELLEEHPQAAVSTLASPLSLLDEAYRDANVVKVVCDERGFALYFSRASIPGQRAGLGDTASDDAPCGLRHVGLYGFRRKALLEFLKRPPGRLERVENLEQLRFLESGQRIVVGTIAALPPGVDTPRDLERIERQLANDGG